MNEAKLANKFLTGPSPNDLKSEIKETNIIIRMPERVRCYEDHSNFHTSTTRKPCNYDTNWASNPRRLFLPRSRRARKIRIVARDRSDKRITMRGTLGKGAPGSWDWVERRWHGRKSWRCIYIVRLEVLEKSFSATWFHFSGGCGPLMMPEINCSVSITGDHFPIKFIWHSRRGDQNSFRWFRKSGYKTKPRITHKCHRKFGILPHLFCGVCGSNAPWQLEMPGIWSGIRVSASHMDIWLFTIAWEFSAVFKNLKTFHLLESTS